MNSILRFLASVCKRSPVSIQKEWIMCSAIWFDDGIVYSNQPFNIERGFVVAGRQHHNCFTTIGVFWEDEISSKLPLRDKQTQGFITSQNRFVSRKEADSIALAAGQTKQLHAGGLYSEDLITGK